MEGIRSLPSVRLEGLGDQDLLDYFVNTWELYELLFGLIRQVAVDALRRPEGWRYSPMAPIEGSEAGNGRVINIASGKASPGDLTESAEAESLLVTWLANAVLDQQARSDERVVL